MDCQQHAQECTNDLSWLCAWGALPLVRWEALRFCTDVHRVDACIADHVDYWLWFENEHLRISLARRQQGLPPLNEGEMYCLHRHVSQMRWRKCARPY
jgi:hypothetical protein